MWHVVGRAQLVRHGVADTEEGVGKGHSSDAGRVMDLFTGLQGGREGCGVEFRQ